MPTTNTATAWRRHLFCGACALALAALLAPAALVPGARAQFVCDSTTPGGADGATATGVASVACGTDANATASSTSVGAGAGGGATATNLGNTAVGETSGQNVTGDQNTAVGRASGQSVTGDDNTAIGVNSGMSVTGSQNTAVGVGAGQFITGSDNVAMGTAAGSGFLTPVTASNTVSIGTGSLAGANNATAIGLNSQATGANAIAIGTGAVATGSVAMGTSASAANGGAAFGDFATATGANSSAIGPSASATYSNSAAFGNGATATRANQQVFGTSSNTYTMPGLTSSRSKRAQGSPTHLVTSNAKGDLAAYTPSDLGLATSGDINAINQQLAKVSDETNSGIALAVAMQNPDLTGSERIGVAANWGAYENANGLGLSLMGVLGHDFVTQGDRIAISGGFGIGFETGNGDDVYGGRVGLQWTH